MFILFFKACYFILFYQGFGLRDSEASREIHQCTVCVCVLQSLNMTAGLSSVRMEGLAYRVETLSAVNVLQALRADSANCVSSTSRLHFITSSHSLSQETLKPHSDPCHTISK